MNIIFAQIGAPTGKGHDGGTFTRAWLLDWLVKRGHKVSVLYLEPRNFDGSPYSEQQRRQDTKKLKELGVAEVRSVSIPLNPNFAQPAKNIFKRLSNSFSYRIAMRKNRVMATRKICESVSDMTGDVCFAFGEVLFHFGGEVNKPVLSWFYHTGEPYNRLYIEYGMKTVLWSKTIASLVYPITQYLYIRRKLKIAKYADYRVCPIHYYTERWKALSKGRLEVSSIPHPARDEGRNLSCLDPTRPPQKKPYRIVLFGHLRAILTTVGLVHFVDHILPALDKRRRHDDFEFHIVGKFEPYPFVRQKLRRSNVYFEGFVDNLAETLNSAHAVLVPIPILPGSGMRLSSACSASACIITHDVTGIGFPELISNENCLMASSGEEFVDALIRVCEDLDLNKRLRVGARMTYEENYRIERCGYSIEKLLIKAMDHPRNNRFFRQKLT